MGVSDTSNLNKIEELELRATEFRKGRDVLIKESRKWAKERDMLNIEYNDVRREAALLKKKRDEYNQRVKELKSLRSRISDEIIDKSQKIKALREKIRMVQPKVSLSEWNNKRLIRELDWKIQTTSIDPSEEKRIINTIRSLEQELKVHEDVEGLEERIVELKAEVGALTVQANDVHNKLIDFAARSQECHEKVLERLNQAKAKKVAANQAHQRFQEFSGRAEETHLRYTEIINRIKEIEQQIKRMEEGVRKKRLEKTREEVNKISRKKLRDKKKLTLEEFKLLIKEDKLKIRT